MSAEAIALNPSFGDRHFRLWHGTQDEIELSIESKMGLSFYNSPTGEEGANVLIVAAEFANHTTTRIIGRAISASMKRNPKPIMVYVSFRVYLLSA